MTQERIIVAISGTLLILIAIALGLYLTIDVMLYRGIMQAINNWGINSSKVVWGIIRAILFEMGVIPSVIIGTIGGVLVKLSVKD